MHSPRVALALRELGFDVVAVADTPELRSLRDPDLVAWAITEDRRIVTENVRDFRPLLVRAYDSGDPHPRLLFTSSRRFPRSRSNPGPLIAALRAWLEDLDAQNQSEAWLE